MEKTEKATPHKRTKEREEGHVMHSREMTAAVCALVMFVLLYALLPLFTDQLANVYRVYLGGVFRAEVERNFTVQGLKGLYSSLLGTVAIAALPILGGAMVVGVTINVLQFGFNFTTKTLMPKFNKINPINGFKRMFSITTVVELVKSLLKLTVMGYIAYSEYMRALPMFANYMEFRLELTFLQLLRSALETAIKMSAAYLIIAGFDYLYQWWKFEKDMRMSKQEILDERKQTDGNPQVKQAQKQKMRRMSVSRMMERVPSADVVITNPTHFAIALRYEDGVDAAPVVVAKGADYIALRIKELARVHNVPTVENRPLARSLFELCEVDDAIPEQLYQAVADVLLFVFKQRNRLPT
ncbi:MAG: flagellar biosynthesis protein FlhB [Oscillospiraceae bacterium]|jgi:flagellar biosynthetic protein FlhB|nr:flagellar biosynthesis protein FlhB [Oscillospiraceae bacterium]